MVLQIKLLLLIPASQIAHQFQSLLICFRSSSMLKCLGKQQVTAQGFGSLLSQWAIQTGLPAPCFCLASPACCGHVKNEPALKDPSLCLFSSVTLPFKHTHTT